LREREFEATSPRMLSYRHLANIMSCCESKLQDDCRPFLEYGNELRPASCGQVAEIDSIVVSCVYLAFEGGNVDKFIA